MTGIWLAETKSLVFQAVIGQAGERQRKETIAEEEERRAENLNFSPPSFSQ